MPNLDHKTKDFLKKIDLLIAKGEIKNHAEVVTTLNWNKSVMSSVKNGSLTVPQHIYNKFKEVYSDQIAALVETKNPNQDDQDYKDKYIALLEQRIKYLEMTSERFTVIEKVLSEVRVDMGIMAAMQKGYQEYWAEHYPPKGVKSAEVLKNIHSKALSSLQKIEKEGIRL